MKFMKSEMFTNLETFFLQIHKRLQIPKFLEMTLQGQKNIVFYLLGWEIFSSHASMGTKVLLFLATDLFLVGRLHTSLGSALKHFLTIF